MVEAIRQARLHVEEFDVFNARLQERFPRLLETWNTDLKAWELNNDLPCPYLPTTTSKHTESVRLCCGTDLYQL